MTRTLIPDWDWANSYCGDGDSYEARSEMLLQFLIENGLTPQSAVLDIGCGCLAPGKALIRYLNADHYIGVEPFGLLVNVALRRFPDLAEKNPRWLWRTDFDASETGRGYDFVVAHSVLSHAAHWQLTQFLVNTRKVVDEGAIMLASYREDQFNSLSSTWRYPDVTTFRLRTVMATGFHAGWKVEPMRDYEERLREVAPNDTHDILRLTAIPSLEMINDLRLAEEAQHAEEREMLQLAEEERVAALEKADDELVAAAGLKP